MPMGKGTYGSKRGRPRKNGAGFNRKKYNKAATKRKPKDKSFKDNFSRDLWDM